MSKFGMRLSVAVLAVALTAAVISDANAFSKRKKKGFFESLFSFESPKFARQKPRRHLFRNDGWGRKEYRSDSDVRIIYGSRPKRTAKAAKVKKKIVPAIADLDPEVGLEDFGMGNLTYVAAKLVPLDGNSFKEPRPAGAAEAAVYEALSAKDLGLRVRPEIRQAMRDHYRAQGFRPIWLENGKLAPRAEAVLKVLAAAPEEGMRAENYLPPTLSDFSAPTGLSSGDLPALVRLDLGLTAMALNYAHDASGGQFDPRRLSLYHDITPEHIAANRTLKVLAWSPFPDAYLRDLQPNHPSYAAMKSALLELRTVIGDQTFVPIDTGKRVKLGQSDDRIVAVRDRLAALGPVELAGEDPAVLDQTLSGALKKFQKSAGLKASGNLDNGTVNALNNHGDERDLRRLVNNMERLRWLPKNLGTRHVFVNQPAFQVQVMVGPSEIWRSNVIVGKPLTQTAVFNDVIEMVVFNPSWGVPPSIVANEYLPKLRRDPNYLDRIGFKVTAASGQQVASSDIDWNAYGRSVPFSIQQPPGRKNALGELKFLFPNAHNIYMHDTPNRNLFGEDVRAFSHGCVRVQNPREFAAVLLGWDKAKVDANTDSKKSQTIRLGTKVPIHIAYFTAWPDETGKIVYFNDIYGRDQSLEKAMTATTVAQR
jgi:L,D-transpeptidase YcbB